MINIINAACQNASKHNEIYNFKPQQKHNNQRGNNEEWQPQQ